MADAEDLKSFSRNRVWVQIPYLTPNRRMKMGKDIQDSVAEDIDLPDEEVKPETEDDEDEDNEANDDEDDDED